MIDDYGDEAGGGGGGKGGLLPDSIKKALVTGLSALFMTEEGIRSALGDMRLPKEAMSFLLQQTERSRKEIFGAVSSELKSFLSTMDLATAVRKALVGMKLEVTAQVRFVDEQRTETTLTSKVASADDEPPTDEGGTPRRRRARRA